MLLFYAQGLYYFLRVVEVPVVRFHRTFWNVSIVEKAELLRRRYYPCFWMTNRHLQTVLGSIAADLMWLVRRRISWRREVVKAFDRNDLFLDWYLNDELRADPDRPFGDGLSLIFGRSFSRSTVDNDKIEKMSQEQPALHSNGRAFHDDFPQQKESTNSFGLYRRQRSDNSSLNLIENRPNEGVRAAVMDSPYQGHIEEYENGLPLDAPILLILFGIGGSRNDPYIKRLATAAAARAWRPVCYSYWRLDWSDHRDMAYVVKHIAERYPAAPMFAVAFSAGAHVLATYLAAVGSDTPVVAAVSVAGCFDFVKTWHYVENTQSALYKNVLVKNMKKCISRHRDNDKRTAMSKKDWDPILQHCGRANIAYDRHIALVSGFTGQSELATEDLRTRRNDKNWYQGCTPSTAYDRRVPYPLPQTKSHYRYPARVLADKIQVTMLIIHARDDPIVSHDDCYDWDRCGANKNIISCRTVRGGHLGW